MLPFTNDEASIMPNDADLARSLKRNL